MLKNGKQSRRKLRRGERVKRFEGARKSWGVEALKWYSDMPKPCNQTAKRLMGWDTRAYCASLWHHSWVRGKGDREIPSFPSGVKKAALDVNWDIAMWEDCPEGWPSLPPSITFRVEINVCYSKGTFTRQRCTKNGNFSCIYHIQPTPLSKRSLFIRIHENDKNNAVLCLPGQ